MMINVMKAAIFKGKGRFEVESVPIPEPGPGQVLVQVSHSCICGSDVHRAFMSGEASAGVILGHEFSGHVAAVGPDVARLKTGDRVVGGGGEKLASDLGDRPPRPLNPAAPWDRRFSPRMVGRSGEAGSLEQGAFAEYKLMWAWQPIRIESGLDNRIAALTEPTAVAVHALERARINLGDWVVVLGLGPIGLLVAQCARAAGATRILGIDLSPRRRQAALELGIEAVLDPRTEADLVRNVVERFGGLGPHVVFECAGAPSTMNQALCMARPLGRVIYVALCWEPATLHPVDWVGRQIELIPAYGYGETGWKTALALLEQGRINPASVLSDEGVFPLDNIQSAFEQCVRPDGVLKPIIVF